MSPPLSRLALLRFRQAFHTSVSALQPQLTIGIRREDPSRIWERRCPLTPAAVDQLVHKDQVTVLIQNCERRIFCADEFIKAGAIIRDDLTAAHIILGIKEVPVAELIPSPLPPPTSLSLVPRTYLMFSHTTKGQPYNMPLLARFIRESSGGKGDLLPRLIDYELLTKTDGKRTVGFGWFAGVAGTLESLAAMAHCHLEHGVSSPFLHTPRPFTHPSLASLRAALRSIGETIANEGTPKSLGPFVVGVTGRGNVAGGVISILGELPIVKVDVGDLPALVSDPTTDLRKIYLVHALPQDYISEIDGKPYDRTSYYASPESYKSDFCTKVAPYLTLFLNGVGWSSSFPRLMTNDQLTIALELAQTIGKERFTNIGDISCDVEGGLEFLPRSSTLSSPFYKTRPPTLPSHLPSVQMMAVDILPASIPFDASHHFSESLLPYLQSLIAEYRGVHMYPGHEEALKRATVASQGKLARPHRWLKELVEAWRESVGSIGSEQTYADFRLGFVDGDDIGRNVGLDRLVNGPFGSAKGAGVESTGISLLSRSRRLHTRTLRNGGGLPKKKVLLFGSGMVARPTVDEMCKRKDVELIVASNSLSEATTLTRSHSNARPLFLDMREQEKVDDLIGEADIVISLLPVAFHPSIAELCIKRRKHMVTASYISPTMRKLHDKALSADVLILNEIGLDPGIDHCSAISLLSDLRAQNKRVVSFTSFCGGLPAPEIADVPLGYKFSWSPRGVLGGALNSAKFRLNGTDWDIPGENILLSYFPDVPILNNMALEGIANRDSLQYADSYRLGPVKELRTLLRGTLRYPGFCDLMHSFKSLGFLENTSSISLYCWESFARQSMEARLGVSINEDPASILSAVSCLIPPPQIPVLLEALNWLSTPRLLPRLPSKPMTPFDLFTTLLAHKLRYEPNERDLVILWHEIVTESGSASPIQEVHTTSLISYGTPTASAMSRCVGLPVAFAALHILDGEVGVRGVNGPMDQSIYGSVLKGLDDVGLGMTETVRKGMGMEGVLMAGLNRRFDM